MNCHALDLQIWLHPYQLLRIVLIFKLINYDIVKKINNLLQVLIKMFD
jgi:hypothetical protein